MTDQGDQATAEPADEAATAPADEAATEPDQHEATSPTLEHLGETIKKAERAADEALAPQREPRD